MIGEQTAELLSAACWLLGLPQRSIEQTLAALMRTQTWRGETRYVYRYSHGGGGFRQAGSLGDSKDAK